MFKIVVGIYDIIAARVAESLVDLNELITQWEFVNLWALMAIIVLIGSGFLPHLVDRIFGEKARIRIQIVGVAWGIALAVIWTALHIGIGRGEFGEVMFNGTLL